MSDLAKTLLTRIVDEAGNGPDTTNALKNLINQVGSEVVTRLSTSETIGSLGAVTVDRLRNETRFADQAIVSRMSANSEGYAMQSGKLRPLGPLSKLDSALDPAAPYYAFLSPGDGVLLLNSKLDVTGKLPGHQDPGLSGYANPIDLQVCEIEPRSARALPAYVPSDTVVAGETFVVSDGVGGSLTIEFVSGAAAPTVPSNIPVDILAPTQEALNAAVVAAVQANYENIPGIESFEDATGTFSVFAAPGAAGNAAFTSYDVATTQLTGGEDQTDVIALALAGNQIKFYRLDDLTFLFTYGSGLAGIGANEIDTPTSLAFSKDLQALFVAGTNEVSNAAEPGFVKAIDVRDVVVSTLTNQEEIILQANDRDQRLLDSSVRNPVRILWDNIDNHLWVIASRSDTPDADGREPTEVVAFEILDELYAGSSVRVVRVLEPRATNSYQLYQIADLDIRVRNGAKLAYLVSRGYGAVEVFNAETQEHVTTLGIRSIDAGIQGNFHGASQHLGSGAAPLLGVPTSLTVGTVPDVGCVVTVFDSANHQLVRIAEDPFSGVNLVNYADFELPVQSRLTGWALAGNLPRDYVSVYYRTSPSEPFSELRNASAPSKTFQIQLQFRIPKATILSQFKLDSLLITSKPVV